MTKGQVLTGKLRDNKAESIKVLSTSKYKCRVINILFGQEFGNSRILTKKSMQYKFN